MSFHLETTVQQRRERQAPPQPPTVRLDFQTVSLFVVLTILTSLFVVGVKNLLVEPRTSGSAAIEATIKAP